MADEETSATRAAPILNNVDRDQENLRRRRTERAHSIINPRDRLFHALFIKIALLYSRVVPKKFRVIIEAVVLIKGLVLFTLLSYLHFSFGRVPLTCLDAINGSWPRNGILRVQIMPDFNLKKQLPRFYSTKKNTVVFHPCHNDKFANMRNCEHMASNLKAFYEHHSQLHSYKEQCYRMNLSDFMFKEKVSFWKDYEHYEYIGTEQTGRSIQGFNPGEIISERKLLAFYERYIGTHETKRHYMFEYSQEFGFLRLSQETRKKLKIPILTVTFDPNKDKCFGDRFSRFILQYFLGYDDVLMNSIKKIADIENNTGYMFNVVTGDHYKFVTWGIGRGSYVISFMLMFVFTISISLLLRYCHQQVFLFIIHILQMMDMNVVLAFPIAPLFTVILSLVGMETIMSEYFNDTTTSFYIILIVWAVDQFDTICCHTVISQRYWLRFFYLYHFIFYAYHYRFNGQYSSLALAATWLLIQHSMLYFFHHYELPAVENNLNEHHDEEAYLDEAVQMIVEGIELVAGQQVHSPRRGGANETPAVDTEESLPTETMVGARVREISNGANRIFIFAADRPFIQVVRDFIRHIHERMNAEPLGPQTGSNDEQSSTQTDFNELQLNPQTASNGLQENLDNNTSTIVSANQNNPETTVLDSRSNPETTISDNRSNPEINNKSVANSKIKTVNTDCMLTRDSVSSLLTNDTSSDLIQIPLTLDDSDMVQMPSNCYNINMTQIPLSSDDSSTTEFPLSANDSIMIEIPLNSDSSRLTQTSISSEGSYGMCKCISSEENLIETESFGENDDKTSRKQCRKKHSEANVLCCIEGHDKECCQMHYNPSEDFKGQTYTQSDRDGLRNNRKNEYDISDSALNRSVSSET